MGTAPRNSVVSDSARAGTFITAAPTKVHPRVATLGPTQGRKRLNEHRDPRLPVGIVFVAQREHADAPHTVPLLRARRERPRRRAADPPS